MCGDRRHFTRHLVVPVAYRKHFPVAVKSHRSHDVLLICVDCHEKANVCTARLKRVLAAEYGAPLGGLGARGPLPEQRRVMRMARTLQNPRIASRIPPARRRELETAVLAGIGASETEELTERHLEMALRLGAEKEGGEGFRSHGEIVVDALRKSGDFGKELHAFMRRWRLLFVESMQPRFFPEDWSVGHVTVLDRPNYFLSEESFAAYKAAMTKNKERKVGKHLGDPFLRAFG